MVPSAPDVVAGGGPNLFMSSSGMLACAHVRHGSAAIAPYERPPWTAHVKIRYRLGLVDKSKARSN